MNSHSGGFAVKTVGTRMLISPPKYVQGAGAMHDLGEHTALLGTNAVVLADRGVWGFVDTAVTDSLAAAGVKLTREVFGGLCTQKEIDRVAAAARAAGADVIVGIGGGTAIDTAKAVGHALDDIAVVSAPTVASTDAPTSALAVIYTEDGAFERYSFFQRNPNLVLVDTALVAGAPSRFIVSGMGDALATWYEARVCVAANRTAMAGGLATGASLALARLCWETLMEYGHQARISAEQHVVTPALEKVTEANTLLSGLGFESCGLAAAHGIHNGLTVSHKVHGMMHGEKVNIGTLAQLVLEGAPTEELDTYLEFSRSVGLPTTLAEIGLVDPGREELLAIGRAATAEGETTHNMPFPVTPEMVADALLAGDAYARATAGKAA
ncbi:glycerol dehydrogenase [Streptomyces sp. NPDC096339]|uniref:glycerol dehydrogenase n=1 Tax=Streptomyces sp. NPDC096339 TaxID=3366086 RepID=UPI0037FDC1A5